MIRKFISTGSLVVLSAASLVAATETYKVDKSHSAASFKVKHLMSKASGKFNDFDAVIELDRANLTNSKVAFTIKAASIDTDNEGRDKHLRSADFFDVEKYPTITFVSKKITAVDKDTFNVTGDFTMRGVTKSVTLPVEVTGFAKDPWGNDRAGFEVTTKIPRKDYGIVWNKTLDEGGFLLGEDVDVTIELETVKQKPAAAAPAAK